MSKRKAVSIYHQLRAVFGDDSFNLTTEYGQYDGVVKQELHVVFAPRDGETYEQMYRRVYDRLNELPARDQ